ncbi:MAG TPA: ATP-binding cassette domain-containing protein [Polyangiaceae bacterium]|nr:ATP-binding cassette domain-containing protein [Polyangiaceae bacterium]
MLDTMPAAEPKPPPEAPQAPENADSANPERHLAVERVQRRFGDFVALEIEKLSIGKGHVAVIIGGSGAGKTTLLKILIGLDRPTSGAVYVDGVDITRLSDRELNQVRRKLGMVFQYSALLDSMNVLDNVAFPLREHTKLKDKEIKSKVIEKLKTLGLENIEKRTPSELSGGMRKRVALARALMLEPQVILYDEPTSGLDPITSRMVDDLILETREKFGVTSVVISHDMTGALLIADEIHVLAKGRLVASGTPKELVESNQELIKKFLDSSGIAAEQLLETRKQAG